jgi:hypothetical protein
VEFLKKRFSVEAGAGLEGAIERLHVFLRHCPLDIALRYRAQNSRSA